MNYDLSSAVSSAGLLPKPVWDTAGFLLVTMCYPRYIEDTGAIYIVSYRIVWYGMVWCGVMWCAEVWYGTVWYGMV